MPTTWTVHIRGADLTWACQSFHIIQQTSARPLSCVSVKSRQTCVDSIGAEPGSWFSLACFVHGFPLSHVRTKLQDIVSLCWFMEKKQRVWTHFINAGVKPSFPKYSWQSSDWKPIRQSKLQIMWRKWFYCFTADPNLHQVKKEWCRGYYMLTQLIKAFTGCKGSSASSHMWCHLGLNTTGSVGTFDGIYCWVVGNLGKSGQEERRNVGSHILLYCPWSFLSIIIPVMLWELLLGRNSQQGRTCR